jgi:hypothetical protein
MTNAIDGSRTFPIVTREVRAALSRQTEAGFSKAFDELLSEELDAAIDLELERDDIARRRTTRPQGAAARRQAADGFAQIEEDRGCE